MTTYNISNRMSAHSFGSYEGATPEEAIAAMLADAGHDGPADADVIATPVLTYAITATFSSNGQADVSCSTPEVLGDAYGVAYATREEAEAVAAELQGSISEYGLDASTVYHVTGL